MVIIYFLYICIVIILFVTLLHVFLSSHLRNYDLKVNKHEKTWQKIQMRCQTTKEYKLKKSEIRKLKNPSMLAAFYEVYSQSSKEEFQQLMANNKQQIIAVAREYRSTTMKAYFAYILHTFQMQNDSLSSEFGDLMKEFVLEKSVYARENSLKALYCLGNAENIVEAFRSLSKNNTYHSEKLITDGLMTFRGDFETLSTLLINHFEEFIECYQLAIINFLLYKNEHKFDDQMITYIHQEDMSLDVKCSALRIIGKVQSEKNKQILVSALDQCNNEYGWEQAAVAATMLGNFEKDEHVVNALCYALTSRNWYVRMNSANSLIKIGLSDERINEILNGDDEYAKNALLYTMHPRKE